MAHLILGVSGSIAAYKAADLASRLKKRGHSVTPILTRSACQLVTPHTFMNVTGNRALVEMFDVENQQTEHIALTDRAELAIVAPATANVIAKMAVGIADDVLTTTLLAVRCPVLVCPAMNTRMWEHPTVGQNLATLRARGVHVLEPDAGLLACGHVGPGRLAEPEAIEREVERLLACASPQASVAPSPALPRSAGEGGPGSGRTFLERQRLERVPEPTAAQAEARYRAQLARDGHLVGSGPLGVDDGEVLHLHRAGSFDEVRRRAEASPLVVQAGATFDVTEWRIESGSLAGTSPGRTADPDAPTAHFRMPKS